MPDLFCIFRSSVCCWVYICYVLIAGKDLSFVEILFSANTIIYTSWNGFFFKQSLLLSEKDNNVSVYVLRFAAILSSSMIEVYEFTKEVVVARGYT